MLEQWSLSSVCPLEDADIRSTDLALSQLGLGHNGTYIVIQQMLEQWSLSSVCPLEDADIRSTDLALSQLGLGHNGTYIMI